jgi:tRNA pseudouridine38-40 synthase
VRLLAIVEYDGTDFAGFQVQAHRGTGERPRTVQEELERALQAITGETTRIVGAGRTDSGVHARGQVVHFDSSAAILGDPPQALRAVNAHLPADVAVHRLRPVSAGFHARFSAVSRRYSYRILNARTPSPLCRRFAHTVRTPLDVPRMAAGARHLLGSHDFVAFGAQEGPGSTRRDLHAATVTARPAQVWAPTAPIWHTQGLDASEDSCAAPPHSGTCFAEHGADWPGASVIDISLEANAFLRHMVRRIVGTLLRVGAGRLEPEDVAAILASGEKARAGPAAPAHGLCLEYVRYGGVGTGGAGGGATGQGSG